MNNFSFFLFVIQEKTFPFSLRTNSFVSLRKQNLFSLKKLVYLFLFKK